jgi:glucosamine--fructose-6-phosphate aminotransferase (isomerizing)
MKAVILAAGEGNRLGPLTERRPKPMLPVGNQPVLEFVLEAVENAGIQEVVFVVGYERNRIQTHFGDGDDWGVDIEYAVQDTQLGTGHEFLSETDTEVVPHLLEERYDGENLLVAVEDVVDQLAGSFALAVTAVGYNGIVVARRDSPLVVGVSADANFVASDVTAFLEHTQDVMFLENGDVAAVKKDDIDVRRDGERVPRETQTVDWEADSAEKAGCNHYMLKEIHEQPQALRQTISGRLNVTSGTVDLDLDLPENYLKSLEEIQIVACGTSYHAGLYARRLLEEHADVRCSVEVASEYEFTGGRDP